MTPKDNLGLTDRTAAGVDFDGLACFPAQANDGADFQATTVLGSVTLAGPGGTGVGAALLEFTSGNGFSAGLVTNGPHPMARLTLTASSTAATVQLVYGVFSGDLILRTGS